MNTCFISKVIEKRYIGPKIDDFFNFIFFMIEYAIVSQWLSQQHILIIINWMITCVGVIPEGTHAYEWRKFFSFTLTASYFSAKFLPLLSAVSVESVKCSFVCLPLWCNFLQKAQKKKKVN